MYDYFLTYHGLINLADGRFMHWQKSEWMSKDKDDFHMNHNGNLSVKEPGIYFIFGQVDMQVRQKPEKKHNFDIKQKIN